MLEAMLKQEFKSTATSTAIPDDYYEQSVQEITAVSATPYSLQKQISESGTREKNIINESSDDVSST